MLPSRVLEEANSAARARREAVADEEVLDLLAPATPERVTALDDARSIFRAEWWTGNSDALAYALREIEGLRAAAGIVPLSDVEDTGGDGEYISFIFCLALTPDAVSEAIN